MAKKKKSDRQAGPFFLLVVLPLAAVILSSWAIARGIQNYVTTSAYFKIRELRAEGISDQKYLEMIKNDVVGMNIFRLDAGVLAQKTQRRFPHFYSVIVRRVLPSQLLIIAKERRPVAWLKRDAYYMIDANGVIVGTAPLSETPTAPLLIGLDAKIPKPKVGGTYTSASLHRPLLLAKILRVRAAEIRQAFETAPWTVTRIDATDPDELSFYLGTDLEVKVGDRNFDARVSLLPSILKTVSGDIARITYIDLRPREPVVATKGS